MCMALFFSFHHIFPKFSLKNLLNFFSDREKVVLTEDFLFLHIARENKRERKFGGALSSIAAAAVARFPSTNQILPSLPQAPPKRALILEIYLALFPGCRAPAQLCPGC